MNDLVERIFAFIVICIIGAVIGIVISMISKKKDAKNAPAMLDELHYILKSQEQKENGWSFVKRNQFLKSSGLRKTNIDHILGQVERYKPVILSEDEVKKEIDQILNDSTDPQIDTFLTKTYMVFRNGKLACVPRIFTMLEARSKRPAHFVLFYKNLFGPLFRYFLTAHPFEKDEVFIAADASSFFLTTHRLFFFKVTSDHLSVFKVLRLEEIESYQSHGTWTQTLDIQLKNKESIEIASLDSVPHDDVVIALCGLLTSHL